MCLSICVLPQMLYKPCTTLFLRVQSSKLSARPLPPLLPHHLSLTNNMFLCTHLRHLPSLSRTAPGAPPGSTFVRSGGGSSKHNSRRLAHHLATFPRLRSQRRTCRARLPLWQLPKLPSKPRTAAPSQAAQTFFLRSSIPMSFLLLRPSRMQLILFDPPRA